MLWSSRVFGKEFVYLGDIWQQVVGDALRVLSDQARGMSSDWIEITQQHRIPVLLTQRHKNETPPYIWGVPINAFLPPDQYLLSFTVVLDHLLNEVLGLAVRVGAAAHGVLLVNGQVLGVSVHCG